MAMAITNPFQRKLEALGYHYPHTDIYSELSKSSYKEFIDLVVWLENVKINHYGDDDDSKHYLCHVDVDNAMAVNAAFASYAKDLGCPRLPIDEGVIDTKAILRILDWILGHAIAKEYKVCADAYNRSSSMQVTEDKDDSSNSTSITNVDPTSLQFRAGLYDICSLLGVRQHTNPAIFLYGLAKFTNHLMSLATTENSLTVATATTAIEVESMDDVFPLGLEINDPILRDATRVLRLLHINDLRKLQTNINDLIRKLQTFTAKPTTNFKLGKVGSW